jgi:hypothetical protein
MPTYTDVELRILDELHDGKPHRVSDLCQVISPTATPSLLRVHLCNMRKRMQPAGQDILPTIVNRTTYYIWVNLISTGEN